MRILAGEFSGRRLVSPPDRETRPMLARVRESLFGVLGDVVEDARVLDLFSGTGSLGLEALSRGATSARFLERDRRALERLKENVRALGVEDRARVVRGDALDARRWSDAGDVGGPGAAPSGPQPEPWAQVVLLDPPYPMLEDSDGRRALVKGLAALAADVVTPAGVIVLHTHRRIRLERDLPAGVACDRREYGSTALWFLWKSVEVDEAGP